MANLEASLPPCRNEPKVRKSPKVWGQSCKTPVWNSIRSVATDIKLQRIGLREKFDNHWLPPSPVKKKNRSTARISHFNPQTSLEPQELRCGWTSCPPPSIGHPTPANAAAAKLWDESALNVVVSKFGSLWAPVVYHRFPIRIYSNCICWYPPFCFDKTKSTTCIADAATIGSLWCGHVVTEANSLLSPQMVNSWPQFPGPISMKTPILEGEGCLTETPLIREEDTLKVLQAAFPSQCVCRYHIYKAKIHMLHVDRQIDR